MADQLIPENHGLTYFRWRLDGDNEEMVSTLGFKLAEGTNAADVDAAADFYNGWRTGFPDDSLMEGWALVGATVRFGPVGVGPVQIHDAINNGTSTGTSTPNNCAILVRKNSAFSGRKNRGRMFLPSGYMAENHVDQRGIMDNTLLTNVSAQMESFRAFMFDNPDSPYERPEIFHLDTGADPDLLAPTPITGFAVQPQIATQRRRMRR